MNYDQLYREAVPNYRQRCRVGELSGWVCAGDAKFATVKLDKGKFLCNVPWADVEVLDERYDGPSGVE